MKRIIQTSLSLLLLTSLEPVIVGDQAFAAKRCSMNLFQDAGVAGCSNSDGVYTGLYSMFSKPPQKKPDSARNRSSSSTAASIAPLVPADLPSVGRTRTTVQLLSINSELSHKGPNANAKLVAGCDNTGNARLLLDFPGYPLFIGNDHLQLAIHGSAGRGVSLVAGKGTGFTELAINGSQAIAGIASVASERSSSKLTFKLKDQDGLSLKANFNATEFKQKMNAVLATCRQT